MIIYKNVNDLAFIIQVLYENILVEILAKLSQSPSYILKYYDSRFAERSVKIYNIVKM